MGKVPCIEFQSGETLYESLIIADCLDEAYPQNKLYPDNPVARAKDKLLISRFNTVINVMYKVHTIVIYSSCKTNIICVNVKLQLFLL